MFRIPVDLGTCVGSSSGHDLLLRYLRGGTVVMAARSFTEDRVDPYAEPIPVVFYSDGRWIWSAQVVAYVDRYGMALPPEFVRHAEALGFQAPGQLPAEVHAEAVAEIRRGGESG